MKLQTAFLAFTLSTSLFAQVNFNDMLQETVSQTNETKNEVKGEWYKKLSSLNKKSEEFSLSARRGGGSGVGGGNSSSLLMDWCDSASEVLDETRINAQEELGLYNDKLSALKLYFEGLKSALEISSGDEVSVNSSITHRSILRGLNLASKLGVIDLIYGDGNYSTKKIDNALYFLDDYYGFILGTAYNLDQSYIYSNESCVECHNTYKSIDQLEKDFIKYVSSQLNFWIKSFIPNYSNQEGAYPTIEIDHALEGLSYLASETARDLSSSYYSNVYRCQTGQLERLSKRIDSFLAKDHDDSIKVSKLTIYREQTNQIITNIMTTNCHY